MKFETRDGGARIAKSFTMSSEEMNSLRRQFLSLEEVTPFSKNPKLAAKVASLGMHREIGTVNDELARFIFDYRTGQVIRRESLKSELIEWKGCSGLKIYSLDSSQLELRTPGFYDLIHPVLSKNEDGSLHSLYIFPEIVNQISATQGVELVLVKAWGMNSIFGGFDPKVGYYQTNLWELKNNDTLKFSELISRGQLAFMGTHDLIAHIAGLNSHEWPALKSLAARVSESLISYFKSTSTPNLSSLVLPYTIGVVLDDLAQPPSYGSKTHRLVMEELLLRLNKNEIPANSAILLTEFPKSFADVINLSRDKEIVNSPERITQALDALISDVTNRSFYI